MMPIDDMVKLLNAATTLSPSLWSLFDVMVPCSPIVGTTEIELMRGPEGIAFANMLGMLNAVYATTNERITITIETENGVRTRKFVRTALVA